MPFILYNTLTKKEEEFVTQVAGKVSMYTCGPTVYSRPHIGNYSSFLLADLLRRWLEVSGYEVTHVKNITDVGHLVADGDAGEDKIEKQAKEEKKDPLEIARFYSSQYIADEKALNMLEPAHRPLATETIKEMIDIIETLIKKGHAYETSDGIYFSVETFPDYGKLSGNMLSDLHAGARVKVDEEKKHPADFALWKKCVGENAHHILRWDTPWGPGFPGWHIECSAMSTKFLGEHIDLHTGGEDNIFPHHECEIAQSESAFGKTFVRHWAHRRRIDLGDQKMSKSLGNVLSLDSIREKGFSPLDLRYYFLSVHYRTNLKFSWKGIEDAKKARWKIIEWMKEVEKGSGDGAASGHAKEVIDVFTAAMNQDLNTPAALAEIFTAMKYYRENQPNAEELETWKQFILLVADTFGCFIDDASKEIPEAVQKLLNERKAARDQKDFQKSDALRDEIKSLGFEVKDAGAEQILKPL